MFGREHNINGQCLKRVYDGIYPQYKGWIKTGGKRIRYTALDSQGKSYYNIVKLKPFCKEHGLNYKMIHKCCIKKHKPCYGWIIMKEEI